MQSWVGFYLNQNDHKYVIIPPTTWEGKGGASAMRTHQQNDVRQESDKEELTLFVDDGNWQEGTEGHNRQQTEEHADGEEELEALQPGPPEVLQVHDVSDENPERQHPWGTKSPGHDFLTDIGGTEDKHFSQHFFCN